MKRKFDCYGLLCIIEKNSWHHFIRADSCRAGFMLYVAS